MDNLDKMDIDEAVRRTQDRLRFEGDTLSDLLVHFQHLVPAALIDDEAWARILKCARDLPITMGALPMGFELPLHEATPHADFGVSLASDTWAAEFFRHRAAANQADATAQAVVRVLDDMATEGSPLRRLIGPKMMLEYDIGSATSDQPAQPGLFVRPYVRPIIAGGKQLSDVGIALDALVSAVGWPRREVEHRQVERVYLAQPVDTRLDSLGVFPPRGRAIRLAIMGLKSPRQLCDFLHRIEWPGDVPAVQSELERFSARLKIFHQGAHLDVSEAGVGTTLGVTPIVKERFSYNTRYWFDDLSDWTPCIEALRGEPVVVQAKLPALAKLVAKPMPLFGKAGRYVLLRGIHHVKLVISEGRLAKAKAYMFMVLSGGPEM